MGQNMPRSPLLYVAPRPLSYYVAGLGNRWRGVLVLDVRPLREDCGVDACYLGRHLVSILELGLWSPILGP